MPENCDALASDLFAILQQEASACGWSVMPLTPLFDSVSYVLYLFTRGLSYISRDLLFYLAQLFIAVMTLLIGGIPAALYERIRGLGESTPVSLGIWLVATALLVLPALMHVTGLK